jgi:hypothetical protein
LEELSVKKAPCLMDLISKFWFNIGMAIFKTFSKRQKEKLKQGQTDVFQYDVLPEPFRVQVIHLWNEALGTYE